MHTHKRLKTTPINYEWAERELPLRLSNGVSVACEDVANREIASEPFLDFATADYSEGVEFDWGSTSIARVPADVAGTAIGLVCLSIFT
jgi:hypothetical protein